MKVAILHDWLNQKIGGAENVLFELAAMYPEADIYTLVYNRKKFQPYLGDRKIQTSYLQKFPSFIKKRPKFLLPFIKRAVSKINLAGYDLVISSSTAWVKNVSLPSHTKHYCYCHSPARMLWDSWPDYINQMRIGPLLRFYVLRLCSKLRLWDFYQSQNGTHFIANSAYVAARIKKFYRQPSKVIYPPVSVHKFKPSTTDKEDFYLILSVLSRYKNVDLAIEAFGKNRKKLVVAGDGPELKSLKEKSKSYPNITFLGRVDEAKKIELMQKARGFIFPSIEDFGITMVESIAAGTAVLALKGGGAQEIIRDQETGQFFDLPSPESLNNALLKFEKNFKGNYKLKNKYVFDKFDSEVFVSNIKKEIDAR